MERQNKRSTSRKRTSRQETYRISSQNHRKARLDAGKVELKVFVEPETKQRLQTIKEEMGLSTLGAALDHLASKL